MSKVLKLSIFFGLFIFVLTLTTTTYAISDNASEKAIEKQELRKQNSAESKNKDKTKNQEEK